MTNRNNMKINLIEYFEESVRRHPNKVAIIDKDREMVFQDLHNKTLLLAQILINRDCEQNKPVAVFLDKSIESVYSDLGVLYSGNFYMNLDIKTPAERISNILRLIRPRTIISTSRYIKTITSIIPDEIDVLLLDEIDWEIAVDDKSILQRLSTIIDTDPSCIINTSGSTGTPKGVVLNHRSFFDFTEWAVETFMFEDDLIMGSLSPIIFDIYSFELCMLMAKASTLVVLPSNLAAFPAKILELLEKHNVNFLFWVPTIMVNIANMDLLSTFKLDNLKTVWFAGEVFPTKQFNYWHSHLPQVTFANLYGPIEITLDCTYYIVDKEIPDEQPLPIGYPCRNTDIIILDNEDKAVTTPNMDGELCVRGSSLAMGYYNNPEKTAAAFIQNPINNSYPEIIYRTGDIVCYNEEGLIMIKGRKDNIIKHMGYRTDLGEIEHVIINTLKLVKNGCIVYNKEAKEITLFYEAEQEISAVDFRKKIGMALPKYMIPTVYHHLDLLKRNTNGKIDRLYYKNLVNNA